MRIKRGINMKQKDSSLTASTDYHLKNILLLLGIFTGFVFIITFSTIYVSDAIKNNNACGCVIPIPIMILILSSLGVFVGATIAYLFLSRLLKAKADLNKQRDFSSEVIFRVLNPEERKVLKYVLENKGMVSQSKISSLLNDRVKAYRIVSRLKDLGLVEIIKDKKTNIIKVQEEIQALFGV